MVRVSNNSDRPKPAETTLGYEVELQESKIASLTNEINRLDGLIDRLIGNKPQTDESAKTLVSVDSLKDAVSRNNRNLGTAIDRLASLNYIIEVEMGGA